MVDGLDTLGQRIVRAARMAVALHVNEVAESHAVVGRGRRVVIGRAGPQVTGDGPVTDYSTDGVPAAAVGMAGSRGAGVSGARLPPLPFAGEGAGE